MAKRTKTRTNMLGKIVKLAREELGLSREELGEPEFSEAYIDTLERGALECGVIRPARVMLEFLATRLQIPLANLWDYPDIDDSLIFR